MHIRKIARAAGTFAMGGAALMTLPAAAQSYQPAPAQPTAPQAPGAAPAAQRQLQLSRGERAALQPLETAVRAQDWAAAAAALPAAQAAAQGADARYFVARAAWQVASGQGNRPAERQALAAIVALPNVAANELPLFLNLQAERALDANDFATAEQAYSRVLQLRPNDPSTLQNLTVVRRRAGNTAGTIETVLQRIQVAEAAGQPVPENLYRLALDAAVRQRQQAPTLDWSRRLLQAYGTPANWNMALNIYRRLAEADGQLTLDVMRLMRAAGALRSENEYVGFATATAQAGFPGETKAILDEGLQRNTIQRSSAGVAQLLPTAERRIAEDRTELPNQVRAARAAATGRQARIAADALYGYARYQEAADLYRVALTKGGEDANLVNLRLGSSLALAGQRPAAETALRTVTGQRADVASLWMVWLARRPS